MSLADRLRARRAAATAAPEPAARVRYAGPYHHDDADGRPTSSWRQWIARPGEILTCGTVATELRIPLRDLVAWEQGRRDLVLGQEVYAWYRARIRERCQGKTLVECLDMVGIPRPEILRALNLA